MSETSEETAVTDQTECPGECEDDCVKCGSGEWALMCDDCRFYAAQDAEVSS